MILLQGHSISPLKKIPLEEMSLQLKERDSTATIVPADMDGITVNSWMVDDTEPGRGIVWRVKSISQAYATRTPTVQLEHAINTLKDRIMFGEHKPKDITGNSKATTATAEQTIRYILSNQSDWVLWRFDYAGTSNPYQFDGDTLFDALETVTSSLKNAWWTYDMTVYPFRLNIIRKDNTAYSELRPGRNLKTITKTIDKSGMYTRFYPIGKDDLHLSDYAVDRNTEYYGVISKVDTDASIDTEAELRRWANERLDDHAEPTVTIDVEGLDLADATGEELDRMWLGYCCRIPLAEFGTTINERIVGLTFPDKLRQPEVVKVTLSNNRADLTKIIADSMKSSGKSKRTSTKQDKEDHAWFEDTNDHVAMCAIGIIGVDAQGNPNWTRLSRLEVNENGIYGEVKSVQGDLVIAETRIDMNENAINLEAKRAKTAEGDLSGRLTVQADKIEAEVTRAKTAEGTLSGRITVEAGKITQIVSAVGKDGQVTAASICLAINNGGSTATINADKIYLLGQTIANTITANYIATKISSIASLLVHDVTADSVSATTLKINSTLGSVSVATAYNGSSLTRSGDTYTLRLAKMNGNYDEYSFSRATSLSAGWDGNRKFTVSASPQGVSRYTTLFSAVPDSDVSWSNGVGTLTLKATMDGGETSYTVGTVTVNAPGAPTELGIYDSNSTKRTGAITLGWGGSIALWGGYTTDGGTTWVWGDQVTVEGKALPQITNVDRKSSGITGSSAGDVSAKSGSYVTFKMAGYDYYIKIG